MPVDKIKLFEKGLKAAKQNLSRAQDENNKKDIEYYSGTVKALEDLLNDARQEKHEK